MPVFVACTMFWVLLLAAVAHATSSIVSTSADGAITFTTSDSSDLFYLPGSPMSAFANNSMDCPLLPITAFATNKTSLTASFFKDALCEYAKDDVYTEAFLQGAYVSCVGSCTIDPSGATFLANKGVKTLFYHGHVTIADSASIATVKASQALSNGPYAGVAVKSSLHIFQAYKLFVDYERSFLNGLTYKGKNTFQSVDSWDSASYSIRIPFPSKLHYTVTPDKPLAGLRFAVKDIIRVKGNILTGGVRAYAQLYNTPSETTAPAVQKLIDLGAVLIGMVKPASLAYGAWPYQSYDYPYSFNPRADGALGLSSSSYGTASAIASYPCLDFALGSDTLGSVRNPADRVGVYGWRPTWGTLNLTGVIPSATSLDTVGFMTRSPYLTKKIQSVWYGETNEHYQSGSFSLPKKIIYPVDVFHVNNSETKDLIDNFLDVVANKLDMSIEKMNVTTLFNKHVDYNSTISDYISDIGTLSDYDNWNLFGKSFVEAYKNQYNGSFPNADPSVLSSWDEAIDDYTIERKEANEARRKAFDSFINTYVIPGNSKTCTDGIFIYQIADTGGGVPEYRDIDYNWYPDFTPFRAASMAPFAHLVDVTIPIGEIAYQSIISQKQEQLVITVNFVAHKGCDVVLANLIEAIADKGLIKTVKTGKVAY